MEKHTEHTLRMAAGADRPKAAIADLVWLSGYWRGQAFGGQVDENWSLPAGGSMVGAFRLVREGEVSLYELIVLVEREGSLVMRVKHFSPALAGWEEKDEAMDFPLVCTGDREAWFDGLTIRRLSDDQLEMYLAIRNRSGELREEHFQYRLCSDR